MSLISSGKGGSGGFDPCPAGAHIARCISVVDMGFQETPWGSKEKVYIGFEVPGVRVKWTKDDEEHEGAALVGNTYTNSIHPDSNLGSALVSWRGRPFTDQEREGFDLTTIAGVPCMLSITHNATQDKVYANIASIMGVPQGTTVPDAENELLVYSPDNPALAGNFDKLPEWLQKKCAAGDTSSKPNDGQMAPGVRTEGVVGMPPRQGDVGYSTMPDGRPSNGPGSDFDDDIPF